MQAPETTATVHGPRSTVHGPTRAALVRLLYALADDELVIGHRNSEWTGLGPILEEDIAFSSMAQDELGHALALYAILASLGEGEPDALAFRRPPEAFGNAVLCELPRGDYAFSLVRHLLYNLAEAVRLEALAGSSFEPLAQAAAKLRPEERYHLMHAASYVQRLARDAAARPRLQTALDAAFPDALGLFEPVEGEAELVAAGIVEPSATLQIRWLDRLAALLRDTGLDLPIEPDADGCPTPTVAPRTGGRQGRHTEHLRQLLDAMQTLHRTDPTATW